MHDATPHEQLRTLTTALADLRSGAMGIGQFSDLAHAQRALLGTLPDRYAQVLQGLLDRLESSALFTEESCSFSATDLHANLETWLDKARDALGPEYR